MTPLKMKNKIFILLIILIIPAMSFGQEIISRLSTNPVIKANHNNMKAKSSKNVMLSIPFFDDFSGSSIYPNDSLWADKYVYINSEFPYMPPTIGVATFDALNDTGAVYPSANSFNFSADSLTSNPIRLDSVFGSVNTALRKSDSIYLSFFYQPEGDTTYGVAPENGDSLVLEFYSPTTNQWNQVWSDTGSTLQQFHNRYHTWFRQVLIPITDSVNYYQKGFRFRFYNFASIITNPLPSWASGNIDIWNLDYVYLNKNRSRADTLYKDVAFVNPAPSMLKNYYEMPWSQYKVDTTAEMKDSLRHVLIRNLDTVTYNTTYTYNVREIGNSWNYTYNGGSYNLLPLSIQNYSYHATPAVGFNFPSNSSDSAEFTITHIVKEGLNGDSHRQNDTSIFYQKFYNYYAYDDGVPESGFGLSPAFSMLAYKFKLNHPDTLRAVEMFFNQTLNNANQQYFNLTVWNDANGYPGDTLCQIKNVRPLFADSLNKYIRYRIDNRNVIVSGTFYVGWKQLTDDLLNIGFDLSNDEHDKIFYNLNDGSGWVNSKYPGALMMRPVLGKTLPLVAGINEIKYKTNEIKVFPNPTSGNDVTIDIPEMKNQDASKYTIQLFDMLGNEVYTSSFTKNINVPNLQNGIYILSVTSNSSNIRYFTRLSIIK